MYSRREHKFFRNMIKKIHQDDFVTQLQKAETLSYFFIDERISSLESYFNLKKEYYTYGENMYFFVYRSKSGRYVRFPFSESGQVLQILGGKIDISEFQESVTQHFSDNILLRVNTFYVGESWSGVDSDISDYVIDLSLYEDTDQLLQSFRKTLRHVLKKDLNYLIERIQKDGNIIEMLYILYYKNIHKKGNIPLSYDIFKSLLQDDNIDCYAVRNEKNEIMSFACFLNGKNHTQYYLSASSDEGRNKSISYHIVWHRMREDMRNGISNFSLGGTKNGGTLEIFKRGWQPSKYAIYDFPIIEKKAEINIYKKIIKRILRFIPDFCMKPLSSVYWRIYFR